MKTPLSLILLLFFITTSCYQEQSADFSEKDMASIKQTMKDYRNAWIEDNQKNVLLTLSDEVVMIRPGDSSKPIIGKNELTEFWFPPSDISYPIFKYEITNEEIHGSGNLAFLQGTSYLSWCTLENGIARDTTTNVSEYLTVLRKEEGNWKIFRQIYNMKSQEYSR